ncbi:MAG TPA: hypothetical protein VFB67_02575 [Candidatus Polarisedimenticolaceae bacterium]|nr:hypothetical protein [Candidatus Polarisedimenticolaceae bacterium]
MFCPVCRDEYRRGFTRCATCDVALVESLDAVPEPSGLREAAAAAAPVGLDEPTVNFCGFLTLEEARAARDACRTGGLKAEILITDAPPDRDGRPKEEFWLRVRPSEARAVAGIVGVDPGVDAGEEGAVFTCSACGATVRDSDAACPGCGLRFDA